jgi:site-specific DNA recombinase
VAKQPRKSRFPASEHGREITHVAAYLRVSTEMQARSGLGRGAQLAKVEAMATVKGWPAPTLYVDDGLSGAKESRDRPALAQMMAAAAAGEIDAIIINSIDRLARKARLTLELAEELTRYGVTLVSCKESIDTATPAGQMILAVLAAMAQFERDLTSERTIAALAEHSRRDGESGGRLPYAYVRELDGVRIARDQARIVRRIFAWRRDGLTLRAIAAQLNKRHYASPQGKHWHHSSVAAVLANEDYYRGGQRGASTLRWPVILKDREGDEHEA